MKKGLKTEIRGLLISGLALILGTIGVQKSEALVALFSNTGTGLIGAAIALLKEELDGADENNIAKMIDKAKTVNDIIDEIK